MSILEERNIPEQNPPVNYSAKSNPVFSTTSLWIIGGLLSVLITAVGYYFIRLDTRMDNIDNKLQIDVNNVQNQLQSNITNLESKYQIDHDKVIKLETIIENLKK